MSGINRVILIGRAGSDPTTRYMPSGGAVTNISIATSETWKDKQTGEKKEAVEWHNIVFFNRLAEVVGEYVRKGSQIYVEGSLQTRKWQDKESGQDRYATEIKANSMQMLDSKSDKAGEGAYKNSPASQAAIDAGSGQDDGFDDSIPF